MRRLFASPSLSLLLLLCFSTRSVASSPTPDWVLTIDELVAGEALIPVPDPTKAEVFIEKEGNTNLTERCVLAVESIAGVGKVAKLRISVSQACDEILIAEPGDGDWIVHHGDPLKAQHTLKHAKLREPLTLTWTRKTGKDSSGNDAIMLDAPDAEAWISKQSFVFVQGNQWIWGELGVENGQVTITPPTLLNTLKTNSPIVTYAKIGEIWTKLSFMVKAGADSGTGGSTFELTEDVCGSDSIRAEVRGAVGSRALSSDEQQNLTKNERKLLLSDWYYIVCFDMRDPERPKSVTRTEPELVEDVLRDTYNRTALEDTRMLTGKRIAVVVWGKPGTSVQISIPGSPDWGETVYLPPLESEAIELHDTDDAADPKAAAHTIRVFAPRAGDSVTIQIDGKAPQGGNLVPAYSLLEARRLEPLYRGALRVGLGFTWSPWDRTYKVSTGLDGVKYIDFDAGNEPLGSIRTGLIDFELTFGYSFFFKLQPSFDRRVNGALFLGAGLVKAGEGGISALSSIHVGPELMVGKGFGIALTASLHRTRWLADDAFVGQPIAGDTVPTRFGVTPVFGIVLNIQPAILSAAGKVASSRYKLFGGS